MILIALLSTLILINLLPFVNAEAVTTYAQLSVTPNPVGVNQQAIVIAWVQPIPPEAGEVFHEFTVTITKPDGTTTILGPVDSWAMGAAMFAYTPTSIGEYTFLFNYPGQTMSSGEEYQASQSQTVKLTVKQERSPDWPKAELPTDYWKGVVNTENREWSQIAGSWLMTYYNSTYTGYGDSGGGYNPYSQAPRSAHIMWTKPATTGGLSGGETGTLGEYSGLSYSSFGNPPIIMNGKLYVNTNPTLGHFRDTEYEGFACYDLRTGEEIWKKDSGGITHGHHYVSNFPGYPGVVSLLWDLTGDWEVYDPFDGKLLMTFENTTAGTDWWWEDPVVYGSDGTMYVYILKGESNSLAMWNSTKAFEAAQIIRTGGDGLQRFNLKLGTYDWTQGIEWTKTIPDRNVDWHTPYSIFGISGNVAIAKSGTAGNWIDYDIAYDLNTGDELWVHDKSQAIQSFYSSTGQGVVAAFDLSTRRWTAYNIQTGAKLWDSEPMGYPWGTYVSYGSTIAYDKLYSGSFDGNLYAYDLNTGNVAWKFYSGDSGTETVMGTWPMWFGPIVADGVVFCGTGEETPTQPLTRGNRVFALDAETGQEIWHIAGYMSLKAVAEGYLIGYNGYDSQIYCFGKGPSATTISAPQTTITKGNSVVITGTITDQSEGQKGTAAISDQSMSAWMEYLHMQKPKPTDATGVQVELNAIDSEGNSIDIGTATSDTSGNFGFSWTPSIEGTYQIVAKFAGTNSYGSSEDTTYLIVGSASESTGSDSTLLLGIVIAALIIAIIAILLVLLKK